MGAFALVAVISSLCGCKGATRAAPAPPEAGAVVASSPALGGGDAGGHAVGLNGNCHVVAAEGTSPRMDPSAPVRIPAGASVTFKTGIVGREVRLEGPALALPCAAETPVLLEGTMRALPGYAGRPGEGWRVATPCGLATWGPGTHRVEVTGDTCVFRAGAGKASVWPAEDGELTLVVEDGGPTGTVAKGEDGIYSVERASVRVRVRPAKGATDAAARVCAEKVADVERVRAMMADGADIGQATALLLAKRRVSRAACAVAQARREALAEADGGPSR